MMGPTPRSGCQCISYINPTMLQSDENSPPVTVTGAVETRTGVSVLMKQYELNRLYLRPNSVNTNRLQPLVWQY